VSTYVIYAYRKLHMCIAKFTHTGSQRV
jgi:hypothetical protein